MGCTSHHYEFRAQRPRDQGLQPMDLRVCLPCFFFFLAPVAKVLKNKKRGLNAKTLKVENKKIGLKTKNSTEHKKLVFVFNFFVCLAHSPA